MRGSRLLITSSAGGAGRFCGRVLWRTCIGGVTEYEALMGGHASRERLYVSCEEWECLVLWRHHRRGSAFSFLL